MLMSVVVVLVVFGFGRLSGVDVSLLASWMGSEVVSPVRRDIGDVA